VALTAEELQELQGLTTVAPKLHGFFHVDKLSAEFREQLSWVQQNSVNTTQSNVVLDASVTNVETQRCLARFNGLRLLKQGDREAYDTFISAQATAGQLSWDNFKRLSDIVCAQSTDAYAALEASCFITKSDQAKLAAAEAGLSPSQDSEQFITDLISHRAKRIYPACRQLTSAAWDLMPVVFFRNAHARHMLDMEGGQNMYVSLRAAIRDKQMTPEHLSLWLSRWIINIAGLEGHIAPQGSRYLTEAVAEVILDLKSALDNLFDKPDHPVLEEYLGKRAKKLQVSSVYLAHLGALMRRYTPEIGQEIQAWFNELSVTQQKDYESTFHQRMQTLQVTPTFRPVLLDNLITLKCSIAQTLTVFHEIELAAEEAYRQGVDAGRISAQTPLCYRELASKCSLSALLDYRKKHDTLPCLVLNDTGLVEEITVGSPSQPALQ
jgi:hypothetical protein